MLGILGGLLGGAGGDFMNKLNPISAISNLIGSGIKGKRMKELSKKQEAEAAKLEEQEMSRREAGSALQRYGFEGAQRRATAQMPGYQQQESIIEEGVADQMANIQQAAGSSIDALGAGSRAVAQGQRAKRNLGAQNQMYQDQAQRQAEGMAMGLGGQQNQMANMYMTQAQQMENAAAQNRMGAVDAWTNAFYQGGQAVDAFTPDNFWTDMFKKKSVNIGMNPA